MDCQLKLMQVTINFWLQNQNPTVKIQSQLGALMNHHLWGQSNSRFILHFITNYTAQEICTTKINMFLYTCIFCVALNHGNTCTVKYCPCICKSNHTLVTMA